MNNLDILYNWIEAKRVKTLILRGSSGSGKTTLAEGLQKYGDFTIYSADEAFVNSEGAFKFEPLRLIEAHAQCLRKFVEDIQKEPQKCRIVDNTNLTVAEVAPYYAIAEAYAAKPAILQVPVDFQVALKRGTHGVSELTLEKQNMRLNRVVFPPLLAYLHSA
jgi:dephospho-CoA kinase